MKNNELILHPIAYIHTGFEQKFGIPRQASLAPSQTGIILFEPEYDLDGIISGIEQFSHLWILWGFDEVTSWNPTVRPPKLGSEDRMGVFATRSPNRPNPVALSAVRLLETFRENGQTGLIISGIDMRDHSPVYDVKPYIPLYDRIEDAAESFTVRTHRAPLRVFFGADCGISDETLRAELKELLSLDPRPGYHREPERIYGLSYKGRNIRFRITDDILTVLSVTDDE